MFGSLYGIRRREYGAAERRTARAVLDRRGRRPPPGPTRAGCAAGSTSRSACIAAPPVLFLDEPTTGLDPRSRSDLWEVLRALVAGGHHAAAHHAVSGGGRPARRQHRRHRQGPRSSPRAPRCNSRSRPATPAWWSRCRHAATAPRRATCSRLTGAEVLVDGAPRLTAAADGLADLITRGGLAAGAARSTWTTSACRGPASTTCSCRSPVTAPKRKSQRSAMTAVDRRPAFSCQRVRTYPDQHRAAVLDHGEAQHDPHQTHAGDAQRRDSAADHVRAAVRVRLRCLDRQRRWRVLPRVPAARHPGADHRVLGVRRRRRALRPMSRRASSTGSGRCPSPGRRC